MGTARTIGNVLTRAAAAFAFSLSTAAPASAFDWTRGALAPPASFAGELGTRLWMGRARTKKDLFDTTGAVQVSRLDYYDIGLFTGEAFARVDFDTGWFLKGYAGGGGLFYGRLNDEDFPPVVTPYSSTNSEQRGGSLYYGSIDGGVRILRGPDFHVGAFVGYHFLRDSVDAYGCAQVVGNPSICAGAVPYDIGVITQHNNWHSLRVGMEAAVELNRRWRVAIDAAWLPFVQLYGTDFHWLRIGSAPGDFTGGLPEDGRGWGYQFDAFVTYRFNDWLNLGGGARYWHARARGHTHFEGRVVGVDAQPQVVHWRADHFGGFIQANIKFGPYRAFNR